MVRVEEVKEKTRYVRPKNTLKKNPNKQQNKTHPKTNKQMMEVTSEI